MRDDNILGYTSPSATFMASLMCCEQGHTQAELHTHTRKSPPSLMVRPPTCTHHTHTRMYTRNTHTHVPPGTAPHHHHTHAPVPTRLHRDRGALLCGQQTDHPGRCCEEFRAHVSTQTSAQHGRHRVRKQAPLDRGWRSCIAIEVGGDNNERRQRTTLQVRGERQLARVASAQHGVEQPSVLRHKDCTVALECPGRCC